MASITIRNIPDATKDLLKVYAAKSGQSLEAYVRNILQQVVRDTADEPVNIVEIAQQYFGEEQGIEITLAERSSNRADVNLEL